MGSGLGLGLGLGLGSNPNPNPNPNANLSAACCCCSRSASAPSRSASWAGRASTWRTSAVARGTRDRARERSPFSIAREVVVVSTTSSSRRRGSVVVAKRTNGSFGERRESWGASLRGRRGPTHKKNFPKFFLSLQFLINAHTQEAEERVKLCRAKPFWRRLVLVRKI